MTDRVEQGQPELLGVLLVALHLQHGEPARLPGTAGPGAQQRRLPAAGRSRDDRHLPRCRAVEAGDEIVAGDQPGGVHTAFTWLLWSPALVCCWREGHAACLQATWRTCYAVAR